MDVKWVKILGWRSNGDGIDPGENGLIEDCFIRTQDDSTYVNGRGIRRVVYWEDSNGATFVLHPLGAVLPDGDILTLSLNCSRVNLFFNIILFERKFYIFTSLHHLHLHLGKYLGGEALNTHPVVVEDCTVVYSRSKGHQWCGGKVFALRAGGGGSGGDTVTFRDNQQTLCDAL